jgi:hypothetical protein
MSGRSWFILANISAVASLCLFTSAGCTRQTESKADKPASVDGAGDEKAESSDPLEALSVASGSELTEGETIQFVAPEGWSAVAVSGLQKAAFQITEGDLSAEINVMRLPGPATKLLPNVNMWRKRVGLEAITQEQLDASVESIDFDDQSAHYITLEGPANGEHPLAMLVVLASDPERASFVKMFGDADLVLREKDNFQSFVKSVRMQPAE